MRPHVQDFDPTTSPPPFSPKSVHHLSYLLLDRHTYTPTNKRASASCQALTCDTVIWRGSDVPVFVYYPYP